MFFYPEVGACLSSPTGEFQSPEGDSLFFYYRDGHLFVKIRLPVSVPRRGFVNWSDGPWSDGQVVRKRKRRVDHGRSDHPTNSVSVPRRGFVNWSNGPWSGGQVLQKLKEHLTNDNRTIRPSDQFRFSPPKGIRCFSTLTALRALLRGDRGFSPPKGIRCFSTRLCRDGANRPWGGRFQSPEGDSLFFY